MIFGYFSELKKVLETYAHIISNYRTAEKAYSDKKGFIEGEITFFDNSILDFAEVKDADQFAKLKYRYHYMDVNKRMIFRYDNAKHYPNLATFPHHKHTATEVEESSEPEVGDVLSEIEMFIAKSRRTPCILQ